MANELNNTHQEIPQGYYGVKNWRKFQHYKHRNPPWIKLHQEIFSSEDWVMLDDASKLLAIVCMVIAAKHNGLVPAIPAYIKRVAYLDSLPNLKPLIECGFLINTLASASESKQLRTNADTETETETETEKKESIVVVASLPQPQKMNGTSDKARGSRLPEDWKPNKDGIDHAVAMFGNDGTAEEFESFRDYWLAVPGAKGRKLDWDRTWRNWCRNSRRKKITNCFTKNKSGFPATPGSPEFEAWRTYFRDTGQGGFVAELEKRRFEGRAFDFQSQWPPGMGENQ